MATVTNYDIDWSTNQITISFDESITAINTGEWFLENQGNTYEGRLSLAGSIGYINPSDDTQAIIEIGQFVLNVVKNQSTDYVELENTGLSNRSVDASTPALDTANTNHGVPFSYTEDQINPTLDEVIYAPATDVNGEVTSFTLKFSKPLVTDLPLTEIFGDDGTNTPVALTTDSTYSKSSTDPRYVTIAVGTTDRTTFSAPFKAATGGISTAATPTGAGWISFFTLTAVAANSPVVKTVLSGTNIVTSFDSIQYDGSSNIVLTFANDVDYLDPTGLTINTGGLVTTLTGGTATISGDEVTISMSDADLSDLQANIFMSGVPAFDSANVSLTAVGASVPVGYITSPLLVGSVNIDPSLVPGVVSFDYYSKDDSSSYDAILTFNVAGFTVADITAFRFQDVATGTPGNTTNLSAGTTVTRIDDYAYGISLNSTDATAINGWATSNPNNVHFGFSAAGAIQYAASESEVTPNYFLAAAVYDSISPEYAYTYNEIAVRSDNLAGELKLTSTSRYDAATIRAAANTTIGGVIQFRDAPTENVPGRVLKVTNYDATDASNPVLTVGWQDAGVTRLVAGSNITLSAETGAVVVSAEGGQTLVDNNGTDVTSVVPGTDITFTNTGGALTIDSTPVVSNSTLALVGLNDGTLVTSTDNVNWTTVTAYTGAQDVEAITFGADLYVLVGGSGVVYTSPDGTTWTQRTSNTTNSLFSVDWNGSLFVASGNQGDIITSPDGITWTARTNPGAGSSAYRVAWGNNVWVGMDAIAAGATPITSTDGITWTAQTQIANFAVNEVRFGGGTFVAVGDNSTNQDGLIYTSTDGVTWTSATLGTVANTTYVDVAYDGTQWIAITNATGLPYAVSTDNGATWGALTGSIPLSSVEAISYGGGAFYVSGVNSTSDGPGVATSTDGSTWTEQSLPAGLTSSWRGWTSFARSSTNPVTSLVAGNNITLNNTGGALTITSTASGGGGATHYTGDAGDVALATNAQINAAITGTAANGDSFVNTNTGSNNTQPYYVYVNSGWRQVSSSASA